MTRGRLAALFDELGLSLDASACFSTLEAAYGEPHRAYHDASHIEDCLARLDEARELCERPAEVEFALWLHDVIHRTRGGDSEGESAEMAADWLTRGGAAADVVGRVRDMILATKHGPEVPAGDAAVMLDIDLSILGRDAEAFDRYDANVRREYRWVPGPLYRRKRREVLEGFLARPRIYVTERFFERYEAQARLNLARSIQELGGG